ncbi:thermonuclease family protein [Pelistega europaea]|nr:thermonuclease family protein [Pelistega europaea]
MLGAKTKIVVLGLVSLIAYASAWAETLEGQVVGVVDGDTIKVLDKMHKQYKIRLDQIDAPELHQPFGQRAKQYLSSLVYKKKVNIEWHDKDRYKRILGTVYYQGNNINYQMVEAGYAWAYTKYLRDGIYKTAQQRAKQQRLGLWREKETIPPWEWRRK